MKLKMIILFVLNVLLAVASLENDYFNQIRNQLDFETIQETTNYGIALSYKIHSG